MSNTEISSTYVKVPSRDLEIDAYLATPSIEGKFAAVIVVQEIFGVNSHIRDVTERIAKLGYVAIAPAMFHRVAPGFDVGYSPEDIQLGVQYMQQTKAGEILSDIEATIAYLKTLPNVKADTIGTIGFCFGGHVAYMAATLPDIKATASFYGGGIATSSFGGDSPTINRTSEIKGTVYTFFGTRDSSIPQEQNQHIEAELKKHSIDHRVFRYDAEHGFFCDQRSSYNAQAASDAWEHVIELFQSKLS
ncbi:MAG: dienelactone hydrolase family protein [Scytonematopsis contorta HA4267-MV1]|jgi:carboxymethylenebutenolidase|nr:dienelactone hydrolase family protein [Scytonematopsis contorta HA4267-MV1]